MDINTAAPIDGKQYFGLAPAKPRSELNMETFLRLLTTQLSNQNPLEPMNDRDFFAQLAQLGTVQGVDKLKDSMDITQANSMVGKTVTAVRLMTEEGSGGVDSFVQGVVRSLVNKNGEFYLSVEEANGGLAEVKLANVRAVSETPQLNSVQHILDAANAANLIGKRITAPHPTFKDSNGLPETMEGDVKGVSFEKGIVYLTVADRLGADQKIPLQNVTGFATSGTTGGANP